MALSNLIDEVKDKSGDDGGGQETSGLSQFWGVKNQYEKLQKPELCPTCGGNNTKKVHWYWRCKDKSCDTLTYIHTDYSVDEERMIE